MSRISISTSKWCTADARLEDARSIHSRMHIQYSLWPHLPLSRELHAYILPLKHADDRMDSGALILVTWIFFPVPLVRSGKRINGLQKKPPILANSVVNCEAGSRDPPLQFY